MENQKKHFQMKSPSKFWLLSTGILLSLLVTSLPLAVKADENLAVTLPSQTEAVTNPTVNSSLAVSDSQPKEIQEVHKQKCKLNRRP